MAFTSGPPHAKHKVMKNSASGEYAGVFRDRNNSAVIQNSAIDTVEAVKTNAKTSDTNNS
jgi:hypothetical protein